MRVVGALVLLVVLTATAAIRVCTSRDVRLLLRDVCNLERRRRAVTAPAFHVDNRYRRQAIAGYSSASGQLDTGAINDFTRDAENGIRGVNMNGNTGLAALRKRRETVRDVMKRCCDQDCDISEFFGACA
ncbi:uncharacterized protein [Panulirus ornatus]|uniref:uncharacterized protein n=1 Tax=Panulirus ornatus TaxID=150431 RepID=UPI003A89B694